MKQFFQITLTGEQVTWLFGKSLAEQGRRHGWAFDEEMTLTQGDLDHLCRALELAARALTKEFQQSFIQESLSHPRKEISP